METEGKAIPERGLGPLSGVVLQTLSQRETTRKSAPLRVRLFLPYPSDYRTAFAFSAILYLVQHR